MNPLQAVTTSPLELAAPFITALALYIFATFFKESRGILADIKLWENKHVEDLIRVVFCQMEDDVIRSLYIPGETSALGEDFPAKRRMIEANISVDRIWIIGQQAGELIENWKQLRNYEYAGRAFCFYGAIANFILSLGIILAILFNFQTHFITNSLIAFGISLSVLIPIVGMVIAFFKTNFLRQRCHRTMEALKSIVELND